METRVDGTWQDGRLTFSAQLTQPVKITLRCSASVDGDAMTGTAKAGRLPMSAPFSGRRVAAVSGAGSQARIVFLGTAGGPTLAEHRHGIATAFVLGEDVYLVDAGLGVANQYVDARLGLDRLRAVLLTHMHGDHVCDLFNLFMFGATAVHGSRPRHREPGAR